MFERFTDRARHVVVLAQEEARLLGHDYIGTEHILLGLIHEWDNLGAVVLRSLGVSYERAREYALEFAAAPRHTTLPQHIPFDPRAKKVLELSLRVSLDVGHNYIGPEHILLGILREDNTDEIRENTVRSAAIQILLKFRVTSPQIRHSMSLGWSGLPLPVKDALTLVVPRHPSNLQNPFSLDGSVLMQTTGRLASLTITSEAPVESSEPPELELLGDAQYVDGRRTVQVLRLLIERPDGTTQAVEIGFGVVTED